MKKILLIVLLCTIFQSISFAQIFEEKTDSSSYQKHRVELGGHLNLMLQALHQKDVLAQSENPPGFKVDTFAQVTKNFNLPTANLDVGVKMVQGIKFDFSLFLASEHHNETWMALGYITVDNFNVLPLLSEKYTSLLTKFMKIKGGFAMPNYGDSWTYRTTNANTRNNPFVTNTLIDSWTTSLYCEAYIFINERDFIMGGITEGSSHLSNETYEENPNAPRNGKPKGTFPAFYVKGAKTFGEDDFTFRTALSLYGQKDSPNKIKLFNGDRSGLPLQEVFNQGDFAGQVSPSIYSDLITYRADFTAKIKNFQATAFVENMNYRTLDKTTGNRSSDKANSFQVFGFLKYGFAQGRGYIAGSGNFANTDLSRKANKFEATASYTLINHLQIKCSYYKQNMLGFDSTVGTSKASAHGFLGTMNVNF